MRVEVLTPLGPGGVAVIESSGPDRLDRILPFLRHRSGRTPDARELSPGRPLLVQFVVDGTVLDELLVLDRPERDCSELHCHGAMPIVRGIVDALGAERATTEPSAAERLLMHASSEEQLALALEQLERADLTDHLRDVTKLARPEREASWVALEARTRLARALGEPCRVVLFGPRNAGKSTLFNRLVLAERALTSPRAGSTRDAVAETVFLGGYPYLVCDSAGEGVPLDTIDRAAQSRARELRKDSIRILVLDRGAPPAADEADWRAGAGLVVHNKSDLPLHPERRAEAEHAIACRADDVAAAPHIRARIGDMLTGLRALPPAPSGGVGGPAALDDAEWQLVIAARARSDLDRATGGVER